MTIEDAAKRAAAEIAVIGRMLEAATAPVTLEDAVRVTGLPARSVMRRIEDLRDAGVAVSGVRIGAGKAGWALAGTAAAEGAAPVRPGETRATVMVAPETDGEAMLVRELAQLERWLGSDAAPMSIAEIARRMAVSPRAARRRISQLQARGIEVVRGRRDGETEGWVLAGVIAREWDFPGGVRMCRKREGEG